MQRCSSFLLCAAARPPTALSPSRLARHRHRRRHRQPQPQPQRFALDTHCGYAHVIRGGPAGALLRMHLSTSPPCDSASALRFPTPAAPIRLPSATSHANGKHVGLLVLRLPPPNHSAHAWATCHGASAHVWSPHFRDSGLCIYLGKATGLWVLSFSVQGVLTSYVLFRCLALVGLVWVP